MAQGPPEITPNATLGVADSKFDVVELWHIVLKRRWSILMVASAVLLASVFYTLSRTKIYQATAVIYFDPNPPRPLGDKVKAVVETKSGYWGRKEFYNTQQRIISSKATLRPIVEKLALQRSPGFVNNKDDLSRGDEELVSVERAVEILGKRLVVQPVRDSRLAEISYRSASPQRALQILN
ncbi:MAG: Wzz/FepE/Etk N-terminal domain-containing protein, partial [Polyangiaceae bacterium]|nr:Wzz/FepE/Etk N-terminal domain-containing protein [Polyangiaceae bacterium]